MPTINHSAKLATSLLALLKAHGALTALVGSGDSCRIYGGRAAQNSAFPRVIFHEIFQGGDHQHDSATSADAGVAETIIQFDVEARTLSGCRAVADAIAECLDGASPGGTPANIQAIFREGGGGAQVMDHDTGDGVAEAHRLLTDYRIIWRDA